ncbi:type II toxin-antitoxin system VapC family toxin [Sphingomonas bacterium]|uniref:type II toxin-antitoxin system VapC family toxin n=1 Tax=Sphingomonas bacterium TaxID=1895847 RepID=UPI001576D867|nr:type II toxin-antitoxin system VapC family toxin [Sphingomonas bacterium]
MPFVVDTSVVVKWAAAEPDRDAAVALIGQHLMAPDLLCAELAHALSKKARAGEMTSVQVLAAQPIIESLIDLRPAAPFSRRALEISLQLGHAAGDCFFLALAEAAELTMVTADLKLVARCVGTAFADLVQPLT